jgi:hypothetical protein
MKRINHIYIAAGILLFSIGCNIGLLCHREAKYTLTKVNVDQVIETLVKDIASRNLPEEQTKELIHQEIAKIDSYLSKIAKENNLVIVPHKAVIAGGIDITEQITDLLRRQNAQ